jgi:D-alanyl-D-alanine carboxypeptidase/D-alanyl-D-alanine-endopeptidase (penicillin-binding protein 4)
MLAALVAACSSPNSPAPHPTPQPTPVWVPKPGPPWSSAAKDDLSRTLSSIFADDITLQSMGIAVVAQDGSTLYMRRALVPVAPASTLKLVVASTALDILGPAYRFATRFVTNVPEEPLGTLRGDLWLVGGGDPTLTSDDLRRGVGALSRQGIREIDGGLQVDDTAFSGPEQNPRWDPDDLSYGYAAGTSAISVDEDTVEFDVTPDPGGGAAAVHVVPDNDSITFDGTIRTVPAGSDSEVTIERQPETSEGSAVEPRNAYFVDGYIAQGEKQAFYKPVLGLPGYVGGAVAAMLSARDITLSGGYHAGAAPQTATTTLWEHHSAPLADIVHEMLVDSNNHTAETLLRYVGERSGHPGTDGAGIAVEKHELSKLGVPRDGMTLYDGSGLAPSDRIMPLTLAKLISAVTRGREGDLFVRSLPLVGIEGTVKHHDLHDALGRTRAKSGHIEDVNALAGTIATMHHGRIAFAFVVNDPRADADIVYEEVDRALDALAAY